MQRLLDVVTLLTRLRTARIARFGTAGRELDGIVNELESELALREEAMGEIDHLLAPRG